MTRVEDLCDGTVEANHMRSSLTDDGLSADNTGSVTDEDLDRILSRYAVTLSETEAQDLRESRRRYYSNGNVSEGNKTTPNKKPSGCLPRGERSTLARRLRVTKGKRGSRRNNRFLNSVFLGQDEESVFDEGKVHPEDNWDAVLNERMMSSPISRMLASEDANVRCAMKPFINISEFEQKQLLAQMSNDQLYYKDGEEEDEESDEENTVQRFQRKKRPKFKKTDIDNQARRALTKYAESDLLSDIDTVLSTFLKDLATYHENERVFSINESEDAKLLSSSSGSFNFMRDFTDLNSQGCPVIRLHLKDSFHRLLAHAACRFYCLQSKSETLSDKRIMTVWCSELATPALPPMGLVQCLKSGIAPEVCWDVHRNPHSKRSKRRRRRAKKKSASDDMEPNAPSGAFNLDEGWCLGGEVDSLECGWLSVDD